MTLYMWNKRYEIGIAEIDAQHRHLVEIINELSDAMMEKKGYIAVPNILEHLADYSKLHFTTEERHMHEMNYPALAEHCQEHLDLTRKVLEFRKGCSTDHDPSSGELLNFLRDWLTSHIITSDQKIGKHYKYSKAMKRE